MVEYPASDMFEHFLVDVREGNWYIGVVFRIGDIEEMGEVFGVGHKAFLIEVVRCFPCTYEKGYFWEV